MAPCTVSQPKPESCSLRAPDPVGAKPLIHWILIGSVGFKNCEGRLKPPMAVLNTGEYSPALAKRKDVPQEPLMLSPASSDSTQVNPTFGLLVPPTRSPVYWSWRHEASKSSFRISGKLKSLPKTGTLSCAKPAQS